MIYFTSDLHFCHDKEFIYKPRGYKTVWDMNNDILTKWNKKVTEQDDVFVLGDIMLNNDMEGLKLLSSLRGKIHIILGNHDTSNRILQYKHCHNVVEVVYATVLDYAKYHFYLSHYPTITSNHETDKPLKSRLLNLFGHTHSTDKFYENNTFMYNVAWDAHKDVISIDSIIEDLKKANEN